MSIYSRTALNKQGGAVLAIALLILLVMTILGVAAIESSSISFKMSANSIYLEEAFNHSESVSNMSIDVIDDYLYEGGWVGITMPTGLAVVQNNGALALSNGSSENRMDNDSLQKDLSYQYLGIKGDVYVLKGSTTHNDQGASAAQLNGYGGAGVSTASAGGAFTYYEIRSVGIGRSNSRAWTASDYRYVK
jgi:type IV pilus assembly protein PilX